MGLSMLPASIPPSPVEPAPTTVCSSSMKVMICPSDSLISLRTAFRRSSKSPRYLAPATIEVRSRETRRRPFRESGTSPSTRRMASPSTTAVLPTPGSPISTGLFLVRRASTWTTRRISWSRPITGSSLPERARSVRSMEYLSRADSPPSDSADVTRLPPRASSNTLVSFSGAAPARVRMARAWESTEARAISRCSVATNWSPSCSAKVSAVASTRAKAPEIVGWVTELPVLDGCLEMSSVARASTAAGSAPTAVSRCPTVLSGVSRRPCSRCTGSADGLPAVRACRTAAVTASRLLVVSFSVFTSPPESEL